MNKVFTLNLVKTCSTSVPSVLTGRKQLLCSLLWCPEGVSGVLHHLSVVMVTVARQLSTSELQQLASTCCRRGWETDRWAERQISVCVCSLKHRLISVWGRSHTWGGNVSTCLKQQRQYCQFLSITVTKLSQCRHGNMVSNDSNMGKKCFGFFLDTYGTFFTYCKVQI